MPFLPCPESLMHTRDTICQAPSLLLANLASVYLLTRKSQPPCQSNNFVQRCSPFCLVDKGIESSSEDSFLHTYILNELLRSFPPLMKPTPQWDLNLVLLSLTRPPFKPLATCSTPHLSMEVAITSARRVSKLGSLVADPPYRPFIKERSLFTPTWTSSLK